MNPSRTRSFAVLLTVLLMWNVRAFAQYDSAKHLTFLRDAYNRHDKNLSEYLLGELSQFLSMNPEAAQAAEAQFLIAKVYEEKGEKHLALSAFLKAFFLYQQSNWAQESNTAARKILLEEEPYKKHTEKWNTLLAQAATPDSATQGFYSYLETLVNFESAKLQHEIAQQAGEFNTNFPSDPRSDMVARWHADAYAQAEKYREAALSYLRFDYLYPESALLPYARHSRGALLSKELSDHKAALEVLTQVTTAHAQSEYAPAAQFLLGEIKREKTKDAPGALVEYRKLVDTYPRSDKVVAALFAMAAINANELKDYTAALAAYDEIVAKHQADKRGSEALEKAAELLKDKVGDFNKAAEYYAKIAEVYPLYEKAPDMLIKAAALCEEKLKDTKKAADYYSLVVSKFPEHKKADEARKKLAKLQ